MRGPSLRHGLWIFVLVDVRRWQPELLTRANQGQSSALSTQSADTVSPQCTGDPIPFPPTVGQIHLSIVRDFYWNQQPIIRARKAPARLGRRIQATLEIDAGVRRSAKALIAAIGNDNP